MIERYCKRFYNIVQQKDDEAIRSKRQGNALRVSRNGGQIDVTRHLDVLHTLKEMYLELVAHFQRIITKRYRKVFLRKLIWRRPQSQIMEAQVKAWMANTPRVRNSVNKSYLEEAI